MTLTVTRTRAKEDLIETIGRMTGVNVGGCLQCMKCSSGCPLAGMTTVSPSQIIRRLQLGADDSVVGSDIVWMCVSCELCHERCPMQIDMAAVMDSLRAVSLQKDPALRKGRVALFDRWFLATVKFFGRTYDLGMIAAYKVSTSSYFRDTDKFPAMLRKRKIAIVPSFKADKKFIKRIFSK